MEAGSPERDYWLRGTDRLLRTGSAFSAGPWPSIGGESRHDRCILYSASLIKPTQAFGLGWVFFSYAALSHVCD